MQLGREAISQVQDLSSLGATSTVHERRNAIRVPTSYRFFQLVSDLVELTKPRIMVLLLISTCCPMILAGGGHVEISLVLWALVGGALVSGSASAINCIYDTDIDTVMERTRNRPLPAGRVSKGTAILFSIAIGVLGLIVLGVKLNWLASAIALFGHFFYVAIYTIWLKRSTPQNIVIGGAAGAIPPLVGWAGVTGGLDLTALLLFLIVFLWTPPHFWALALNKNTDYRRAGIPMLPVVSGEAVTHRQMLWYAIALLPVSLMLIHSSPYLGWCSYAAMTGLGLVFAYKVYQLKQLSNGDAEAKVRKAWDVFGFSLVYLALFFVSIVVDSTIV